ncbi:MAG TPA: hypothetical protein VHV47_01430 [Opitutaceae bacterium]|jgi:hypothetical protein|nr:hypothetical protein [Opitutaceae bacterium]
MRHEALVLAALAALLGGCAAPSPPGPGSSAAELAADRARREERLKLMQEYWQDAAGGRETPAGGRAPLLLHYPAGTYDGVAFGPRAAPDPSLAEPVR